MERERLKGNLDLLLLSVLAADFVRTARAGGLSSRTVIIRYALHNAMLPVVTTLGMVFSFLLGANVLVEKVFAWPGIGSYAVEALITLGLEPAQNRFHADLPA